VCVNVCGKRYVNAAEQNASYHCYSDRIYYVYVRKNIYLDNKSNTIM